MALVDATVEAEPRPPGGSRAATTPVEDDRRAYVLGGSGGLRHRADGALGTWAGIAVVLAPQVAEEVTPMVSISGSLIVPRRPQPERVFFAWEDVVQDDTSGPVRILVLRDRRYAPDDPPAANGHPVPPHLRESS